MVTFSFQMDMPLLMNGTAFYTYLLTFFYNQCLQEYLIRMYSVHHAHDTPSLSFTPFPSLTEPTGPPTSFHVVVLNTTAIEVQWNLPLRQLRNGIIRGYKLFVQQQRGRQERMINIAGSGTTEYIVSGLEPGTAYIVSALAYTVGDGPRSIHLTVLTPLVSE